MIYLIDSLNTILGYDEMSVSITGIDKELVLPMLLFEDYKAFLHTRSVEKLKRYIKIIDLINQDPLVECPNVDVKDVVIYYDYANENFYLIEVLPTTSKV